MHQYFLPEGDTRGIRLQKNPYPWELDRAPKSWGGKLDTSSSGISKLNHKTKLMAHPRNFRHHINTEGGELDPIFFLNCLIPHGYPAAHPLGENNNRGITLSDIKI